MTPGNGQTTSISKTGVTDPTALTTDALMREVYVINQAMDLRFSFYDRLLADADKQRLEQKADTKSAVDAALAAAKEAVKEQTISTEKAISKSETLFYSTLENIKADVIDLKKFRDQSVGKQTATVALVGIMFALISLAMRFL